MAKLVKTKTGFQVRHGTNNLLLGSVQGTGKQSKLKAMKMQRMIKKRSCGLKGQRC